MFAFKFSIILETGKRFGAQCLLQYNLGGRKNINPDHTKLILKPLLIMAINL